MKQSFDFRLILIFCFLWIVPQSLFSQQEIGSLKSAVSENDSISHSDTLLAEPYLIKANQLSKEIRYDSAIVYYKKVVALYKPIISKIEKHSIWEKYIQCYNGIGYNLVRKGEYAAAATYLDTALNTGLQKLGNIHLEVANSNHYLGILEYRRGNYNQSIDFYNTALDIRVRILGESHPDVATNYNNIGVVYLNTGRYDQALENYRKSLDIRLAAFGETHQDVAISYNNIGDIYLRQGDYNQASSYYEKALAIKIETLGETHPAVATSYHSIGVANYYKGDFDRVIENFNNALSIRLQVYGEEHPEVATGHNSIGNVHLAKGDYDQALRFYEKALAVKLASLGENHRDIATSYNNIGTVYLNKGDYDQALAYYQKSLTIMISILGETHADVAGSYNNIGLVFAYKKDFDQALDFYNKSLTIGIGTLGKSHLFIAGCYNNIGLIYFEKGDYQRAIEFYNKGLAIRQKGLGNAHPEVAIIYNNIGLAYVEKGDYGRAAEEYNKSLTIRLQTFGNAHPDVAESYRNLGEMYSRQGNSQRALEFYQNAIMALVADFDNNDVYSNPLLENISSKIELLSVLKLKAVEFEKIFNANPNKNRVKYIQTAVSTNQLILSLLDQIRSEYITEASKLQVGEKALEIYENAIRTTLKLFDITGEKSYREQAFAAAEKSKFAVLQGALADTKAKQFAGIPDSILNRENELRINLAFYENQILIEREKGQRAEADRIQFFRDKHFAARQKFNHLIKTLEANYPKYYELKYHNEAIAVADVQQKLDNQTAFIEYFLGDSTIYTFAITKNDFLVNVLPRDFELEAQVNSFPISMIVQQSKNVRQYPELASHFFQLLLAPVLAKIEATKLVIVADGYLHYLPFAVLLTEAVGENYNGRDDRNLPYLINTYILSHAYSAKLWTQIGDKIGEPPEHEYLGIAPVFFPNKNTSIREKDASTNSNSTAVAEIPNVSSLPASREEVLSIRALFKKNDGFFKRWYNRLWGSEPGVYLGQDATELLVKSGLLNSSRHLHFATHAFINSNVPALSGLVLARDSTSAEDGVLHVSEIYNLHFNTDLVVLSACETGQGKLVSGEGLIGFSRAFFYAGAKNLLVSLWKVSDTSTKKLMQYFYRNLLDGKSKAEALQAAQRALINGNSTYANPFYWAPFILIGE